LGDVLALDEYQAMHDAMKEAIAIVGGPKKLGAKLGVSQSAVSQWTRVPHQHVLTVEKLCRRKVTRYRMRPDIFGKRAA